MLRCYLQHGRTAIPVNPKESSIEGQPCVASLAGIGGNVQEDLAVSVITPPSEFWFFGFAWCDGAWVSAMMTVTVMDVSHTHTHNPIPPTPTYPTKPATPKTIEVTLAVLEEAAKLGIARLWLQPGCEDGSVLAKAKELGLDATLIYGGPCVLVQLGFDDSYRPPGAASGSAL